MQALLAVQSGLHDLLGTARATKARAAQGMDLEDVLKLHRVSACLDTAPGRARVEQQPAVLALTARPVQLPECFAHGLHAIRIPTVAACYHFLCVG